MKEQPTKELELKEWILDLSSYGRNAECNPSAMNDNFDWESLGNISSVVLSKLMKSLGERGRDIPPGSYARSTTLGSGGGVESDWNKGGGVGTGVKVFGRTPDTAIQHSPDTDEESSREDRTISYSVDR